MPRYLRLHGRLWIGVDAATGTTDRFDEGHIDGVKVDSQPIGLSVFLPRAIDDTATDVDNVSAAFVYSALVALGFIISMAWNEIVPGD